MPRITNAELDALIMVTDPPADSRELHLGRGWAAQIHSALIELRNARKTIKGLRESIRRDWTP